MVTLRTLGECVAEIGTTRLGPDAERLFAVLLCLGLERERLANRTALTALLWPDVAEDRGSHSLRQAVYRLRALGVPLLADRSHLWIDSGGLELDCAPLLDPSPEPDGFVHRVRGHFLGGYHPKFSDPYGEWLDRQRDLVNARIRRLFLAEIARLKARGDWAGVECMAARCLTIDPLNEEATLARAEAAALQGGKAQALSILDGYLKEVGPQAREIRLPATVLRRRIAEATNLERPRAITETPFFGRAREMAELNRALQLAHAGSGSGYLFWGEPGIGKTRLMQEFTRAVSLGTAQIVRVGCQSNDDRRPLSMFVDMIPRLLGMPGALGCSPSAMRFLRRLTEHDPKEPLSSIDPRDAATVYANVRKSVLDLLDAVAAESLLVLVIEDVHWLDAGSWDVIADALPWLSSRRVLLLLTSREPDAERTRGIRELPGLHRVHLAPLDREAVDALSATIVQRSGTPLAPDVAEWCATSCGGNPYHLTELVLHGLRAGRPSKLPASLSQLIAERLGRLQPLSLHVLQGVSVLGAHSTLDRLERLLDQRRVDLLDALNELERSGLIESDGARLLSKHELLSQSAVHRLSVSARRLLHRHAATVLERDAQEAPAPAMQWACAEHWREAGEVGRALSYLQECARYALESGAPADALLLLERAASLAGTAEERGGLIREKVAVLAHSGKWRTLSDQLRELDRTSSEDLSNGFSHDDSELRRAEALWRCEANYDAAIPILGRCVRDRTAPAPHRLKAAAMSLICCDNTRRVEDATTIYSLVQPLLRSKVVPQGDQLRVATIFHASFGDVVEGATSARQLTGFFPRCSVEQAVRDLLLAGTALRTAGDEEDAFASYADALSLAKKHQMFAFAGAAATSLASLTFCQADVESAEIWLNEARKFGQPAEDATYAANLIGLQIRFDLHARRLDRVGDLFAQLRGATPYYPKRHKIIIRATHVRYQLAMEGPVNARPYLQELQALLEDFCGGMGSDYIAAGICEAHEALHETSAARDFLSEYSSTSRRERSSLPPELLRFLPQDDHLKIPKSKSPTR